MEFEKRGDHIGVFHDAVSDDICNYLIDNYRYYEEGGWASHRREYDGGSELDKSDSSAPLGERVTSPQYNRLRAEREGFFFDILNYECFPAYKQAYSLRDDIGIFSYDGKIQKTEKTEGYHQWHYESDNPNSRHRVLAWMLYLNDIEEGGETEFLYQSCRFKPKKGTVMIWPGQFTHMHRGNPPLNDTKYICTGWGEYYNE
jgi:hypothetical protein